MKIWRRLNRGDRKKMKKVIKIIFFTILMLYSSLNADTIIVDIDGTGDYTTIQEGIDNSQDGDIVLVYPGRYIENVNFNGHSVTLGSLELTTGNEVYIDSTIIDGNRSGSCLTVINGEVATVRGFTITNGSGTDMSAGNRGGGIIAHHGYSSSSGLSIVNCIIKDNIAEQGGGVFICGSHDLIYTPIFSGVTIKENHSISGGGIQNIFCRPTFDPDNLCNIYNNHAGIGQDIVASDSCHIHVVVDTFTVFKPEGYFAEYLQYYPNDIGEFSFDIQHSWMEEINNDLYVAPDGDNNNSGLSQNDPLKTIALATYRIASDSVNPKTVHVAEGDYSQALNDQIFPISLKSNTSLVGENIDSKIIGDDSLFNTLIMIYNEKENINIFNFSFESDMILQSAIINFHDNKNVTFKNLQFNDIMFRYGSPIYSYTADSVIYKNILIHNNDSNVVGGIEHDKYNATLNNCIFTDNYAHGVYSYILKLCLSEYGTVENCIFDNNSNNRSDIALFILSYHQFCNPTLEVKNSIITNNTTPSKPVMSCASTDPMGDVFITNNTFSGNEAQKAALTVGGNVEISNNIFWDDDMPSEIFVWDLSAYGIISTLDIQYNDIKDSIDGVWNQNGANIVHWLDGNIGADPQFTGTGDFPYYLSSTSPCIDAGTPDTTGLHLPCLDAAGNPRIYGGRIDMGALEWQGYSVDPDTNVVNNLYFFKNTPNPFKDQTTISFTSLDYDRVREYQVSIYNSRGQLVRRFYGPDEHFWAINEIVWDGKDMDGNITAPGVYFYSIEFEDTAVVRKMVKVR
jgi:hypothetical protein